MKIGTVGDHGCWISGTSNTTGQETAVFGDGGCQLPDYHAILIHL